MKKADATLEEAFMKLINDETESGKNIETDKKVEDNSKEDKIENDEKNKKEEE